MALPIPTVTQLPDGQVQYGYLLASTPTGKVAADSLLLAIRAAGFSTPINTVQTFAKFLNCIFASALSASEVPTLSGLIVAASPDSPPSPGFFQGTGSPEGVLTADIGSLFQNVDGIAAALWVKESGNGTNTGWVPK